MAKSKKGRDLNGVVLLDKAYGISSNKALQNLKILFDAKKAGHTGSLDPMATGLLPVCFGEATKFSQYLLNADKVYSARLKLGQKTSTADQEGEVLLERPCDFAFEVLVEVLSEFTGALKQVPSMFSAIKKDGQPLYKLARKGVEVERKARDIFIHELRLTSSREDFEKEREIEIYVACSKGTYIRNLAEDIGEAAGCGAHLIGLRRLKTGPFEQMIAESELRSAKDSGGLEALDTHLLPCDALLFHLPEIDINATQGLAVKQGRVVDDLENPNKINGLVRIFEREGDANRVFLGLGEVEELSILKAKRLLSTA